MARACAGRARLLIRSRPATAATARSVWCAGAARPRERGLPAARRRWCSAAACHRSRRRRGAAEAGGRDVRRGGRGRRPAMPIGGATVTILSLCRPEVSAAEQIRGRAQGSRRGVVHRGRSLPAALGARPPRLTDRDVRDRWIGRVEAAHGPVPLIAVVAGSCSGAAGARRWPRGSRSCSRGGTAPAATLPGRLASPCGSALVPQPASAAPRQVMRTMRRHLDQVPPAFPLKLVPERLTDWVPRPLRVARPLVLAGSSPRRRGPLDPRRHRRNRPRGTFAGSAYSNNFSLGHGSQHAIDLLKTHTSRASPGLDRDRLPR